MFSNLADEDKLLGLTKVIDNNLPKLSTTIACFSSLFDRYNTALGFYNQPAYLFTL